MKPLGSFPWCRALPRLALPWGAAVSVARRQARQTLGRVRHGRVAVAGIYIAPTGALSTDAVDPTKVGRRRHPWIVLLLPNSSRSSTSSSTTEKAHNYPAFSKVKFCCTRKARKARPLLVINSFPSVMVATW